MDKKRGRRILAAVLVLCIMAGMVAWPEGAQRVKAEELTYGDFAYEVLEDGTVSVTKYTGMDAEVTVPDVIDGKSVTEIGGAAFSDCGNITRITLPSVLKCINKDEDSNGQNGAFSHCTKLTEIVIPDGVTVIGERAFMGCSSLEEIVIPDNVTSIQVAAFSYCAGLKKVIIPNGVLSLEAAAFSSCKSLEEIIIPDSVTSMESLLFMDCDKLKKVKLPAGIASIESNIFNSCTSLKEINIPVSVKSIKIGVFSSCDNLTDVYYSGTEEQWNEIEINTQGNQALKKEIIHFNSSMPDDDSTGYEDYEYEILDDDTIIITKYTGSGTIVNVPLQIDGKSITRIGEEAFADCGGIEEVTLPIGVTDIGRHAFRNCEKITKMTLPDSLTNIGYGAFAECRGLTEINVPDSVAAIEAVAFKGCENLEKINIPDGLSSLESRIFEGCQNLREIMIPGSVTRIGANAFSDCVSLNKIVLSEGLIRIDAAPFLACNALVQLNIPVSVKEIDSSAFNDCDNFKDIYYAGTKEQWEEVKISGYESYLERWESINIHFADDITSDFEYKVLDDATVEITKYTGSGESVTVPSELDGKIVTKIGEKSFFNCENLKEAVIPAGVTEIDMDAFYNCPNLMLIGAEPASQNYASEIGVLFNKTWTELVRCPEGISGEYSIWRAGTASVRDYAFHNCKKLEGITVQDGVIKIGEGAFAGCERAAYVTLPESVTEIGSAAFSGCSSLRTLQIPKEVKEIKRDTFFGCSSLTEVGIPDGITQIGSMAFVNCDNLKSITIPVSVTKIANAAFSVGAIRPSRLEDVYYEGTREQWEQIEVLGEDKGSVAESLWLNATIHFKNSPIVLPEEPIQPEVRNPKEELERLKSADPFSLEKDFSHYLSAEQMDILQSYLFTWLAEVNYACQYSGSSEVKELVMKKAGIDPQGDFASGMEQAITHVSVKTPFGTKTFEITMGLGKPDGSGNLYPGYGVMHYEVLEKGGIPSDVPVSGQIVRNYYTDMGPFVESVKKAAEDSLHGTYQWEKLEDAVTAGILVDKNVAEIVGNKNGSFSDGTFTIFAEPLFAYSKIVRIACPVDVHVYGMDGKEAGSIVNNQPSGGNQNVRLDVDGDTKTVYLAGDDYYLNLRGTGTGTMKYEVEEIANEDVQRTVQFLELQLKQDMQYEGYVFRPLNIDRDMYALRTKGSGGQEVIYPDSDTYEASFKKVQQLSLSQKNTALESDRTVQLSASHLPLDASNPNLRWMTDNESVARVDGNGLVTAVGSGRATVTVTTKDGSFLRQFCVIDVAGGSTDNDSDGNGGGNTGGSNGGTGGDGPGSGGGSGNTGGSGGTGGSAGGSGSGGSGTSDGTGQKPSIVKVHYVLQFDLNGGTKTSRKTMTLLSGDIPGIMPKAQRKDYTFSGWYTKQQGGEKINGDKPLDAAATLYARWAKAAAPAKPASLKLASKKKGQIQAAFQKVNGAAGYQIEYSENKNFTSAKMIEVKASAKSKTMTGLKARKKYYVRMRAYSLDSMNNRVYGVYGTVKSVKVKA